MAYQEQSGNRLDQTGEYRVGIHIRLAVFRRIQKRERRSASGRKPWRDNDVNPFSPVHQGIAAQQPLGSIQKSAMTDANRLFSVGGCEIRPAAGEQFVGVSLQRGSLIAEHGE